MRLFGGMIASAQSVLYGHSILNHNFLLVLHKTSCSCEWFLLVRKLSADAVASLLNGGGGALLGSGDNDALLDVLTDYFINNTEEGDTGKVNAVYKQNVW